MKKLDPIGYIEFQDNVHKLLFLDKKKNGKKEYYVLKNDGKTRLYLNKKLIHTNIFYEDEYSSFLEFYGKKIEFTVEEKKGPSRKAMPHKRKCETCDKVVTLYRQNMRPAIAINKATGAKELFEGFFVRGYDGGVYWSNNQVVFCKKCWNKILANTGYLKKFRENLLHSKIVRDTINSTIKKKK